MTNDVFPTGIASGDPLTDRVILWTRVATDAAHPVPVDWVIARDRELTDVVEHGSALAVADHDHAISVDATGLAPATTYFYGFEALGQQSPVGRTRTLPEGPLDSIRFAMVSCARFNAGYFNAYDRIADRAERDEIEFLLHLGDYIYETSSTPPATQTPGADVGRPFDPPNECVTLDDYRRRYRQANLDPAVLRLRALLPIIATLDDHEFADGAWREGADNHHEEEFGPWSVRKAAAFKAREEACPIRRPDPDDVTRIFRKVQLGDLADLVLTDGRSRRDQPVEPPAMDDPSRTALGAEQKAFLIDAITTSTTPWRLWGNPSMLSTVWKPGITDPLLEQALLKLKLIRPDGQGCDPDQWDGYPAERDSILAAFEEAQVRDLVVLSGDIHVGIGNHVHRDPFHAGDADPIAVEMVTASITSQNLDDKLGYPYGGSAEAEQHFLDEFPHMRWANFDGHGYVVVDVDRDRVEGTWWFVDTVLEPAAGEHSPAHAVVRRGTPRLEITRTGA